MYPVSSIAKSCYQSQNYKIWKQFTTLYETAHKVFKLLSIAKLQNLKAIHNERAEAIKTYLVVINRKTTKFESNSQRFSGNCEMLMCCYQSQNYKIWKQFTTDSIHEFELESCYQSQNYKIWKQFTTCFEWMNIVQLLLSIAKLQNLKAIHNQGLLPGEAPLLLSIAKLQNLKAIHNSSQASSLSTAVVINRKTTKFESNSQLWRSPNSKTTGCYQSQNYKIWKQFTTYY